MQIAKKRTFSGNKESIPCDSLIEYISITKQCSLNTGIKFQDGIVVQMKVMMTSAPYCAQFVVVNDLNDIYRGYIFARRNGTNVSELQLWCFYTDDTRIYWNSSLNTIYDFEFKFGTTIYVKSNGQLIEQKTQSADNVPQMQDFYMSLFSRINYSSGAFSEYMLGRCYYAKISIGNTVLREYIPCRIGQTAYLYDKVSKQMYSSNGANQFELGPDIS